MTRVALPAFAPSVNWRYSSAIILVTVSTPRNRSVPHPERLVGTMGATVVSDLLQSSKVFPSGRRAIMRWLVPRDSRDDRIAELDAERVVKVCASQSPSDRGSRLADRGIEKAVGPARRAA